MKHTIAYCWVCFDSN